MNRFHWLWRCYASFLLLLSLGCAQIAVHAQDSAAIRNLPIEAVRSSGTKDMLVLYLTGDGGWNRFSQDLGTTFSARGYSFVALNSRKYFWEAKTPDTFAKDVNLITTYYLQVWKKSSVLIVGYSFGADVAAFLPTRLSKNIVSKTRLLVLLSAAASTNFVVKLSDLIGNSDTSDHKFKVGAELLKSPVHVLCLFGSEEDLILKKELRSGPMMKVEELPGSHHYNQNANLLVNRILQHLPK